MGQKPLAAATFEHVQDSVENIAQEVGAWSFLGFWVGRYDRFPLSTSC